MDFGEGFISEVSCACVAGIEYLLEVGGFVGEIGATTTEGTLAVH